MTFPSVLEEKPSITYCVYDEAKRCANPMALLAELPEPGTNTALISHAGFSRPTLNQLAWDESAI